MIKRVYRFSWLARIFCLLLAGLWPSVFRLSTAADSIWIMLGWWILVLLFGWAAIMSFIGQIVVDEDGLTYHNLFFQRRQAPWGEIQHLRSDFTAPVGGEGITLRVYQVHDRRNRLLVMIGPSWIAHYKDLLRDILLHIPDDAKTDVNVYHAIRRKGETVQEACRALGQERQALRTCSPL